MKLGNVGIVVSARTASSRLPGKALLPLGGQPMVLFLLDRLRALRGGNIVLATTTLPSDDRLTEVVSAYGVPVFRGSPADLVQRHCDVATEFGFETLVRITADCPFVDAALIEWCLAAADQEDCDLLTTKGTFPIGLDAEVFSVAVLRTLHTGGQLSAQDREHLTLHFYNNAYRVSKAQPPADWPISRQVFTVDTQADYELAQHIVERTRCGNFAIKTLLELE